MKHHVQYSECPLVIKHFIPNSFNLQMRDYDFKENPQITLKKVPTNPFKNIKLTESALVQQGFKIVFKNKSSEKYKPRSQIRPSKILKAIKKSLISEKEIQNKIFQQQFQIEKEDTEFSQSRVLNAKLFQHDAIKHRLSINTFNQKINPEKSSFRKRLSVKHVDLGGTTTTKFSEYKSLAKSKKSQKEKIRLMKTHQTTKKNYEDQKGKRKNSPLKQKRQGLYLARSKTLGTLLKKQIQQVTDSSFCQQKHLKLDLNIRGSKAPESQVTDHWKKLLLQNFSKNSIKLPYY